MLPCTSLLWKTLIAQVIRTTHLFPEQGTAKHRTSSAKRGFLRKNAPSAFVFVVLSRSGHVVGWAEPRWAVFGLF
jgi:hypothetical protein